MNPNLLINGSFINLRAASSRFNSEIDDGSYYNVYRHFFEGRGVDRAGHVYFGHIPYDPNEPETYHFIMCKYFIFCPVHKKMIAIRSHGGPLYLSSLLFTPNLAETYPMLEEMRKLIGQAGKEAGFDHPILQMDETTMDSLVQEFSVKFDTLDKIQIHGNTLIKQRLAFDDCAFVPLVK